MRSIYRLYEFLVLDDHIGIVRESQYFFHDEISWRLVDVPDPEDPDPERYAIIASVTDALVSSFNYKIRLGLRRGITNNKPYLIPEFKKEVNPPFETAPSWCSRIGPLTETCSIIPGRTGGGINHEELAEKCRQSIIDVLGPFVKRNILADATEFWNI